MSSCLPSPSIRSLFGTEAAYSGLKQAGVSFFIHYLDDFLFFVSPAEDFPATVVLSTILAMLSHLGYLWQLIRSKVRLR